MKATSQSLLSRRYLPKLSVPSSMRLRATGSRNFDRCRKARLRKWFRRWHTRLFARTLVRMVTKKSAPHSQCQKNSTGRAFLDQQINHHSSSSIKLKKCSKKYPTSHENQTISTNVNFYISKTWRHRVSHITWTWMISKTKNHLEVRIKCRFHMLVPCPNSATAQKFSRITTQDPKPSAFKTVQTAHPSLITS